MNHEGSIASKRSTVYPARTGKDKTTLMLRLPNQIGALVEAITPLKKNEVNMTWIESFPFSEGNTQGDPTYLF